MTRRVAVTLAVVLAGGLAAAGSATWVTVSTWTVIDDAVDIRVAGAQAAPGVGASAFVVISAAVALAIARRWGRVVAAAGVGLGGLLAGASAVVVLLDPARVAATAARTSVGVGALSSAPQVTAMPWAAVVLGGAAVVLAAWVGLASPRWGSSSGRHDVAMGRGSGATTEPQDTTDRSTWDALSRGEDPTAPDG